MPMAKDMMNNLELSSEEEVQVIIDTCMSLQEETGLDFFLRRKKDLNYYLYLTTHGRSLLYKDNKVKAPKFPFKYCGVDVALHRDIYYPL